ncbi:hypothetical protein NPIL_555271 [Nephila pilipes]|uniref:Uncharacterized protein n=1 Tax=Nephila pilipes TaxID=299642 RepID=A0A8X6TWI8_NEPPI|nr:hypothetical protein NPIL_555271 [Nephila pilipes]
MSNRCKMVLPHMSNFCSRNTLTTDLSPSILCSRNRQATQSHSNGFLVGEIFEVQYVRLKSTNFDVRDAIISEHQQIFLHMVRAAICSVQNAIVCEGA